MPKNRNQGVAAIIMDAIHLIAEQSNIKHIILFADENIHSFYKKQGYINIEAKCRFAAIEEKQSHSVIEKSVNNIMMVRSESPEIFKNKHIDLLGEMF